MKIGQKILLGLVGTLSFSLFNIATFSQYTYAEGVKNKVCEELANAEDVDESVLQAAGCSGPTGKHKNISELANTIINVAMSLAGIVAVGALILAGQRYIAAGGDAAKIASAKRTIVYAIVSLVISFLAFAIVKFVITSLNI